MWKPRASFEDCRNLWLLGAGQSHKEISSDLVEIYMDLQAKAQPRVHVLGPYYTDVPIDKFKQNHKTLKGTVQERLKNPEGKNASELEEEWVQERLETLKQQVTSHCQLILCPITECDESRDSLLLVANGELIP